MLGSPHPAINKQFLVQLQILQPKDVFVSIYIDLLHDTLSSSVVRFHPSTSLSLQGMSSLIHPDEPSVTLVSSMMALLPN